MAPGYKPGSGARPQGDYLEKVIEMEHIYKTNQGYLGEYQGECNGCEECKRQYGAISRVCFADKVQNASFTKADICPAVVCFTLPEQS